MRVDGSVAKGYEGVIDALAGSGWGVAVAALVGGRRVVDVWTSDLSGASLICDVLAYHGGGMPESEAEQAAVMAAWGAWFGSLGDAVLDGGNPTGLSKTVASDGSTSDGGGHESDQRLRRTRSVTGWPTEPVPRRLDAVGTLGRFADELIVDVLDALRPDDAPT